MVAIYCLDIRNKTPLVKLPKEVISHINKYKNNEFKKISKLGWSFLFKLLKDKYHLNLVKDRVTFNKNGKPYLKSESLFFSLSHSLNLIAIAISSKDIGVDIEKLIPNEISNTLYKRILNKNQIKQYLKSKNKLDYLTKVWTKKESYIKNKGLSVLNIKSLLNININNVKTIEVFDCDNNKYYLSYN